jgi:beta-phosphoglucomutase-like phosphatase (HAD superfamily)
MSPTRDLQLVIFDCDGVLVDSEVISAGLDRFADLAVEPLDRVRGVDHAA